MADETWPVLDTGRTAEEWEAAYARVKRDRDAAIARAEKAERERDEERFLATERGEMLTKLEAEMNDLRFKLAAIQKQRDEATARWSSAYSELHEARAAYQGTISTLKLRIEEVQKERDGARAQLATARAEGAREALREASREFRRHGLGPEPPAEIHGEDDARREAWDDAADWCDLRRALLAKDDAASRFAATLERTREHDGGVLAMAEPAALYRVRCDEWGWVESWRVGDGSASVTWTHDEARARAMTSAEIDDMRRRVLTTRFLRIETVPMSWPGDETDEELLAALRELDGKREGAEGDE